MIFFNLYNHVVNLLILQSGAAVVSVRRCFFVLHFTLPLVQEFWQKTLTSLYNHVIINSQNCESAAYI